MKVFTEAKAPDQELFLALFPSEDRSTDVDCWLVDKTGKKIAKIFEFRDRDKMHIYMNSMFKDQLMKNGINTDRFHFNNSELKTV